MTLIASGYGYATHVRTARKVHRCNHWRAFSLFDGAECGAAILPGEKYVECINAPYSDSPVYKIVDYDRPHSSSSRKPCWYSMRLCLRCAAKELRSFPEVRALALAHGYPDD